MKGCILREKMGLLSLFAAIALVCCGEDSGAWPVTAPPEGCSDATISAFRDAAAGDDAWYRLSGELVSVTDADAGSFYLADDTGYVLVYQMDGFSSYGFTPGDNISIYARKGSHLGRAEARNARYAGHARAPYGGYRSPVPGASWLELPAMKRKDGRVFLHHASKGGGRNYSLCYDLRHHVPVWEAYVLCVGNRGAGKRTDAYAQDPLLDRDALVRSRILPGFMVYFGSTDAAAAAARCAVSAAWRQGPSDPQRPLLYTAAVPYSLFMTMRRSEHHEKNHSP